MRRYYAVKSGAQHAIISPSKHDNPTDACMEVFGEVDSTMQYKQLGGSTAQWANITVKRALLDSRIGWYPLIIKEKPKHEDRENAKRRH